LGLVVANFNSDGADASEDKIGVENGHDIDFKIS
jgi:hypothetical protein